MPRYPVSGPNHGNNPRVNPAGSQFFRWCQDNGETIVIQHETVLIEEGRVTPNLYLMLKVQAKSEQPESEDEGRVQSNLQ